MSKILVVLRPAWRNYWLGFLIAGILLALALRSVLPGTSRLVSFIGPEIWFLASLVVLGFVSYRRFSWKFLLDDKRVSRHYGLMARNLQSIRIRDLRSVELDQTLVQRLFGVGDLSFYSSGSDVAEVRFVGIVDPLGWREKIDDAVDKIKGINE